MKLGKAWTEYQSINSHLCIHDRKFRWGTAIHKNYIFILNASFRIKSISRLQSIFMFILLQFRLWLFHKVNYISKLEDILPQLFKVNALLFETQMYNLQDFKYNSPQEQRTEIAKL